MQRNKDPLLAVLRETLPSVGMVLEVASGTGEHAAYFARSLPKLTWQPSDPSLDARASISAWREAEALPNLLPPLDLDAADATWPLSKADAVVCINMVHISPWTATQGLFRAAGAILSAGAPLILYGPYLQSDVPTAASNLAFDADLRRRDPRWGLRQLDDVFALAEEHGFASDAVTSMPKNNLSIIVRRQ